VIAPKDTAAPGTARTGTTQPDSAVTAGDVVAGDVVGGDVAWGLLTDAAAGELVALAQRCLAADGGLPLASDERFLRRRYFGAGATAVAGRTPDGRLVAAGSVRPTSADGGVSITGLVDPEVRGRGLGSHLLDHHLAEAALRIGSAAADTGRQPAAGPAGSAVAAGDAGPAAAGVGPAADPDAANLITLETESLTPEVEELFTSRGFEQVFAEDILRFDLEDRAGHRAGDRTAQVVGYGAGDRAGAGDGDGAGDGNGAGAGDAGVPLTPWPEGTTLVDWSDATSTRFHAVYAAAFRERPGFPDWPAAQWIEDTADDDGFRADWSVLASVPGVGDAGFITCAQGWIEQVGVVPAARGIGLGAALLGEALRRMRAEGADGALLTVNVDNPAARLYRGLGFTDRGRRARFRRLARV
jgi:mycothiol synthase